MFREDGFGKMLPLWNRSWRRFPGINWVRLGSSRLTILFLSEAEPAVAELVAGAPFGGILPNSFEILRSTFCGWKGVAHRALKSIGRNRSGDFQIRLQKVQEQPVFAQLFPFRKTELGDELFVAFMRGHRQERTTWG